MVGVLLSGLGATYRMRTFLACTNRQFSEMHLHADLSVNAFKS